MTKRTDVIDLAVVRVQKSAGILIIQERVDGKWVDTFSYGRGTKQAEVVAKARELKTTWVARYCSGGGGGGLAAPYGEQHKRASAT